jgi:hypothetical protein
MGNLGDSLVEPEALRIETPKLLEVRPGWERETAQTHDL